MSGSKHPHLDGIKFIFSDVFKNGQHKSPSCPYVKDLDEILKKAYYSFDVEHKAIAQYEKLKLKKENEAHVSQYNNQTSSDNTTTSQFNKFDPDNTTSDARPSNFNTAVNYSSSILKPLPATRKNKDSPTISKGVNLNLQDFELDNNLDPFSNCELNTIDDKKILLDVFKTTVLTSNTTTSTSSKNSQPETQNAIVKEELVHHNGAVKHTGQVKNKQMLLNQLGDLLTDEVTKSVEKSKPTSSNGYPRSTKEENKNFTNNYSPLVKTPPVAKPRTAPKDNTRSLEEKRKFEETLNKALTSLPQLPTPTARKKAPEPVSYPVTAYKRKEGDVQSLLRGLTEEERNFVNNVAQMGFSTQLVLRCLQKFGIDQSKVVSRLINITKLKEKNKLYEYNNIDETLDIYNGDIKKTHKFLEVLLQLSQMGFPQDEIKGVLLLTSGEESLNRDKALQTLMDKKR